MIRGMASNRPSRVSVRNGIRFDRDVKPTSGDPPHQPKRSGCKLLGLDQIIADGKAYQVAEAPKSHLLHNVVSVAFDSPR